MGGDAARQQYEDASGIRYHQVKHAVPEAAFSWIARTRAGKVRPHIRSGDVVLEFGAGVGWNIAPLECARRIGFDAAQFLGPLLEKRGVQFVSNLEQLEAGSIDVVICHHVLEHVIDPAEVLGQVQALLKAGGRLLLFVPFEKERRLQRFDPTDSDHHLFAWNPQTLGNLVGACAYELRSVGLGRFGYDRFAAVWGARTGLGEFGFRCIRTTAQLFRPRLEVRLVAVKNG